MSGELLPDGSGAPRPNGNHRTPQARQRPPSQASDPNGGDDTIWQAVDAIVAAGLWDATVFLLTWDDWGGFDDTPPPPPDGGSQPVGPVLLRDGTTLSPPNDQPVRPRPKAGVN